VDSGVPLFLLYFFRQKKPGSPRLPFETYPGIYDILYAPYPGPYPQVNDAAREVVNLTIYSAKDLEFLQKSLYKAESRGTITLDKRFIEPGLVVEDQCRWSCRSCPAPRMSRFLINNNHSIVPCKHGGVVGKIGDRFRDIKKNMKVYREKEIKRRGCNTCPVRESCSKCLYPYPMDSSEYCRLRRQFPMMGELFTLMEIVRRVSFPAKHKTDGISMQVGSADQKEQQIVKESLRGIIYGDECYIYDLDREKARPVSRVFMDILIHLMQGMELDALVSHLTKAYAVSTQEMERTIKKALSIAESHGYLLKAL
jgi:radical SAM protein with 4Fe4S-binding SPASM domain